MSSPYSHKPIVDEISARILAAIPTITKIFTHPQQISEASANKLYIYPSNVDTVNRHVGRVRLRYTFEIVYVMPWSDGDDALEKKETTANAIYDAMITGPHFGSLGDLHGISSINYAAMPEKDMDRILVLPVNFFIETDSPR
jgi:hypothetical protein